MRRIISGVLTVVFAVGSLTPPAAAGTVSGQILPPAGAMVRATAAYRPAAMLGLTVRPDNPLQLDFIIDSGDSGLQGPALESESAKLINYFLTALTLPEDQLWVNLSPYEKDRIIPDTLARTEMGRDMLAQDYLLKQLTASLMYPEDDLGRAFWDRILRLSQQRFGTTELPANTFNKIWIIPEYADVFARDGSVFVVDSHLSVMLEEDYLAKEGHQAELPGDDEEMDEATKELIREIMIPEIEREINQGENFAQLRQIFNSMILAVWYKKNLKESLLGRIYADRKLVKGVDHVDPQTKLAIYEQYLDAFRKGVFNYVREDVDPVTRESVPRKYFSGGVAAIDQAQIAEVAAAPAALLARAATSYQVRTDLTALRPADNAILVDKEDGPDWDDAGIVLEELLTDPFVPAELKYWHALDFIDNLRAHISDGQFARPETLEVYRQALLFVEPPRRYDDTGIVRTEARTGQLRDLYLRQLDLLSRIASRTQNTLRLEPAVMIEDLEAEVLYSELQTALLNSAQFVGVKVALLKLLSEQNRVQKTYNRILLEYPVKEYERAARAVQLWEALSEEDQESVGSIVVLEDEAMPLGVDDIGLIPEARTLVVSESYFMDTGNVRGRITLEQTLEESQVDAVVERITSRRSISVEKARRELPELRERMQPLFSDLFGEGAVVPKFAYIRPTPTALVIQADTESLQELRSFHTVSALEDMADLEDSTGEELSAESAPLFARLRDLMDDYPDYILSRFHDEMVSYLTGGLLRTYSVDALINFYRRNYQNALYELIHDTVTDQPLRRALYNEAQRVLTADNPRWARVEQQVRDNKALIDRIVDKRATLIVRSLFGDGEAGSQELDEVNRLLVEHRAYREASHELRALLQFIPPGKMGRLQLHEDRLDEKLRAQKDDRPILHRRPQEPTATTSENQMGRARGFATSAGDLRIVALGMAQSIWIREHEFQHVVNAGYTLHMVPGITLAKEFTAQWRRIVKRSTRFPALTTDGAMTAESVKEVLQGYLPAGRTPERTFVGPFQIVHAPWRASPDKPDNFFAHVVMPFDESKFFFGAPTNPDSVDWRFDESTVFWEGEVAGTPLSFIEQRWPYALNHFMIVPQRSAHRPQILQGPDVELMLRVAQEQPLPGFRLAFNSLKAGASINHLHLHGLTVPGDTTALEQAALAPVARLDDVTVSQVDGYGAQGLFFAGSTPAGTAARAYEYIAQLQQQDIAHAVIATPRGIYVMPVHGNIITSYGMTWSFYELMGYIVNSDTDRDLSWVREEHILQEMREVALTAEEFGATYRDLWTSGRVTESDGAVLAGMPAYGQEITVTVAAGGMRIDGRPLANGLPDIRHDLKHIAFAQVTGRSSVLDHLTYGAYSTRAWDDFTFREGIHAGNMEEIFVRAMEVYLNAGTDMPEAQRRAAIEADLGKPLADLPAELGVSLEDGSALRQALDAYQRLDRQLVEDGEVRYTHRYTPRFLQPQESGDAAMTAAEHEEQRANVSRIYDAMAGNFDITVGEPAFRDNDRVAAMAGMFPKGPDGQRRAVETDIYSVALTQLPKAMRDWMRDVLVADWLKIFDAAGEEVDHFIPQRDTYHVSVSVVQDLAAHPGDALGVLGRPEERLTDSQRERITADLRRIIAAKDKVVLTPVGARVGPDGTLIFVFEYDPALYEIRAGAVEAVRAQHAAFTGRPKPMVHITLSRTLTNPDVTPRLKAEWDAFAAKYRSVSAAEMGLDGPVTVNELEFSHERRWMHTDIGEAEVMPLIGSDQAELAQFHPQSLLGLITIDGWRLKTAVEAQGEFNTYDTPLDEELARQGYTRERVIEEIVAAVEELKPVDPWLASDALEHILREVLENAVDAFMQRADFKDEFLFGYDVRSTPRGVVIRFLDNGTPLFVSETSEEKRVQKRVYHNRYGGKHAGMTIIRHQLVNFIDGEGEAELVDLTARYRDPAHKLEFMTMLEILLPEDGAVLAEAPVRRGPGQLTLMFPVLRRLKIKPVDQGSQTKVLSADDWDYVLKALPADPNGVFVIENYERFRPYLGGLVPAYQIVRLLDTFGLYLEEAVIMDKIPGPNLFDDIRAAYEAGDMAAVDRILGEYTSLLEEIYDRGLLMPDVKLLNFKKHDGRYWLLDAGIVLDPAQFRDGRGDIETVGEFFMQRHLENLRNLGAVGGYELVSRYRDAMAAIGLADGEGFLKKAAEIPPTMTPAPMPDIAAGVVRSLHALADVPAEVDVTAGAEDSAVLSETGRAGLTDETPLEELGLSKHSQRILRQRGLLTLGAIKELHRSGGLNEIEGMRSPLSKVRIEINELMLDLISAPDEAVFGSIPTIGGGDQLNLDAFVLAAGEAFMEHLQAAWSGRLRFYFNMSPTRRSVQDFLVADPRDGRQWIYIAAQTTAEAGGSEAYLLRIKDVQKDRIRFDKLMLQRVTGFVPAELLIEEEYGVTGSDEVLIRQAERYMQNMRPAMLQELANGQAEPGSVLGAVRNNDGDDMIFLAVPIMDPAIPPSMFSHMYVEMRAADRFFVPVHAAGDRGPHVLVRLPRSIKMTTAALDRLAGTITVQTFIGRRLGAEAVTQALTEAAESLGGDEVELMVDAAVDNLHARSGEQQDKAWLRQDLREALQADGFMEDEAMIGDGLSHKIGEFREVRTERGVVNLLDGRRHMYPQDFEELSALLESGEITAQYIEGLHRKYTENGSLENHKAQLEAVREFIRLADTQEVVLGVELTAEEWGNPEQRIYDSVLFRTPLIRAFFEDPRVEDLDYLKEVEAKHAGMIDDLYLIYRGIPEYLMARGEIDDRAFKVLPMEDPDSKREGKAALDELLKLQRSYEERLSQLGIDKEELSWMDEAVEKSMQVTDDTAAAKIMSEAIAKLPDPELRRIAEKGYSMFHALIVQTAHIRNLYMARKLLQSINPEHKTLILVGQAHVNDLIQILSKYTLSEIEAMIRQEISANQGMDAPQTSDSAILVNAPFLVGITQGQIEAVAQAMVAGTLTGRRLGYLRVLQGLDDARVFMQRGRRIDLKLDLAVTNLFTVSGGNLDKPWLRRDLGSALETIGVSVDWATVSEEREYPPVKEDDFVRFFQRSSWWPKIIANLERFKDQGVIHSYGLTGSFSRGQYRLEESKDLDIALVLRANPSRANQLKPLADYIDAVNADPAIPAHITLTAFGPSYRFDSVSGELEYQFVRHPDLVSEYVKRDNYRGDRFVVLRDDQTDPSTLWALHKKLVALGPLAVDDVRALLDVQEDQAITVKDMPPSRIDRWTTQRGNVYVLQQHIHVATPDVIAFNKRSQMGDLTREFVEEIYQRYREDGTIDRLSAELDLYRDFVNSQGEKAVLFGIESTTELQMDLENAKSHYDDFIKTMRGIGITERPVVNALFMMFAGVEMYYVAAESIDGRTVSISGLETRAPKMRSLALSAYALRNKSRMMSLAVSLGYGRLARDEIVDLINSYSQLSAEEYLAADLPAEIAVLVSEPELAEYVEEQVKLARSILHLDYYTRNLHIAANILRRLTAGNEMVITIGLAHTDEIMDLVENYSLEEIESMIAEDDWQTSTISELYADPRLISKIEPIEQVARFVSDIEDLDAFVEAPLREAARTLFRKGIRTFWTSANRKDIAQGSPAVIMFLYDELSDRNKVVSHSVGQVLDNISTVIRIPMNADSTVGDIHRAAMEIVNRFEDQPMDRSIAEIVRPGRDQAMTAQTKRLPGAAFIFGTGNNASIIDAEGNIITEGGALTELGHNIVRRARNGEWVFTGRRTRGDRPVLERDDVSFEGSFSGPNIARRFAHNYYAVDFLRLYVPQLPEEFANHAQMVELVRGNPTDEAKRKLRAVGIDVILRAVSTAVARQDARAISFVNRLGREIGYALAAWLKHYADEPWTENIVMVSGVGEHFARIEGQSDGSNVFIGGIRAGVILGLSQAREAGELPGISDEHIRRIARGIQRSSMGWERELLAARLTDEEKAALGEEDASEALAVGISLGGTKIGSGLISADGEITARDEVRWRQRYHESSEGIVEGIVNQVAALLNASRAPHLRKVGIAFAGPVDRANGIVGTPFKAPNLPFEKYNLGKAVRDQLTRVLEQRYGITAPEIIIDIYNDNVAAAIGEQSPRGSLSVTKDEERELESDEAMQASAPEQERSFDTVEDIASVFPYAGLINLPALAQSGVVLTGHVDRVPEQTSIENYVLKARHEMKIFEGGVYRGAVPLWEYRKPGQLVNIPLEKFTDARWVLPLHAQYRPKLTENQGLVRTLLWLYLVSRPELQGEKIVAIGAAEPFRRTLDEMRAVFGDYRTFTEDDFGFPLSQPAYEFTVPVLTAEQRAAVEAYLAKFMPISDDAAMLSQVLINDENEAVSIRPILQRMADQLKAYTGLLRMGRLKFTLGRPPYMRYYHKKVSVAVDGRDDSRWVVFTAEQDHSVPIEASYISDEVRRALFTGLSVMVKVNSRTGQKIEWGEVMIRGRQGFVPLSLLGQMEGVSTQLLTHWIHVKIQGLLAQDTKARDVVLAALDKPSMDLLAARNIDQEPILFMEYPNDIDYPQPGFKTTEEFRFEEPDTEIVYVEFQRMEPDAAMTADAPGGIDLNPVNMRLNVAGDPQPFNGNGLPLTPAVPIEGIRPVIIHIVPVPNLPLLLGLNEDQRPPLAAGDPVPPAGQLSLSPADRRGMMIAALNGAVE